MRLECQARRVQLELVLERQQRTVERLLAGAAAALPTAKLEHVKALSSHWYDVRLYVQKYLHHLQTRMVDISTDGI